MRPFTKLCREIQRRLAGLGFSLESRADAHVTLARAEGIALPRVAPLEISSIEVSSFSLYESFTEPEGARYVNLATFAAQRIRRKASPNDGSSAMKESG